MTRRRAKGPDSTAMLSATSALAAVAIVLLALFAGGGATIAGDGGVISGPREIAPERGDEDVELRAPAAEEEVARIRAHLAGALDELRDRNPTGLTDEQQRARAEAIRWLADYRAAGVFPHNHVRPDRVPVFVDPHGTPCAVGYLLLRSGEVELVEDVVREANLARVPELASDPRLVAWLERRGLTVDEATRIQPTYGGGDGFDDQGPSEYEGETVGAAILTAAASALVAATEPNPDRFDWMGAAAVTGAVGHGVLTGISLSEDRDVADWQIATNIVGALVGAVVGGRRLARWGEARDGGAGDAAPGDAGTAEEEGPTGRVAAAGEGGDRGSGALTLSPYVASIGARVTAGFQLRF